jgi:FkbM family methyltransferase
MYEKTTIRFEDARHEMRCLSPQDLMFRRWVAWGRFYEDKLLRAIMDKQLTGCYVDVGANLGNHTVFFANFCRPTHVVAVESCPEMCEVLETNCAHNISTPYTVHNLCAYHSTGYVAEIGSVDLQNCGATTATVTVDGDVPTATIDSLVSDKGSVAVIKLDVESGELDALKGAAETLAQHRPLLAIEAATVEERERLSEFLSQFQYKRTTGNLAHTPTYLWESV